METKLDKILKEVKKEFDIDYVEWHPKKKCYIGVKRPFKRVVEIYERDE